MENPINTNNKPLSQTLGSFSFVTDANTDVQKLQEEVRALNGRIAKLEEAVRTLSGRIEKLEEMKFRLP